MDKSFVQIERAIEAGDHQCLADLLNEMAASHPTPTRIKRAGKTIYVNQAQAFIRTRSWPAQAWSGEDVYQARQQLGDVSEREARILIQSTAQFVYSLVNMISAEIFDIPQICYHPVWRHFRSLTSGGKNCILHAITRQTQSSMWVDRILDEHGRYLFSEMEGNRTSCWRGCIQWPYETATAGLEVFIKHGWMDLGRNEDLVEVMNQASANGRLNVVLWAQDMTGCPRIPNVEVSLLKHRRLNGKENSVEVSEAWTSLQERWGPAPDETVRRAWRVLIKNHRIADGARISNALGMVEREMDQRELWGGDEKAFLLNEAFQQLNAEVLVEYIGRGWKFDQEQLAQCVERAKNASTSFDTKKIKEQREELILLMNRERLLYISGDPGKRAGPVRPSM